MNKRLAAIGAAVLAAASASLVTFTAAASASVDPTADVVGIKSSGSVYAGTNNPSEAGALVATTPPVGGTGTYAVEILNRSGITRSYVVSLDRFSGAGVPHLFAGSKDVTPAAGNWYTTAPVQSGKSAKLTLKIKTAAFPDFTEVQVNTFESNFDYYTGSVFAIASTKQTKGGGLNAQIKAAAGQSVVTNDAYSPVVSGPALTLGKSAKYTIVLRNNTAAPNQFEAYLTRFNDCADSAFTMQAKVGNVDVTSALQSDYVTPVLAVGKSVTIHVTVTSVGSTPDACDDYMDWYLYTAYGTSAGFITDAVG